jgi:hypothetical protein
VSASGTDRYTDSGLFSFSVSSDSCAWTITVRASSPTRTAVNATPIRTLAKITSYLPRDGSGSSVSPSATPGASLAFAGVGLGDFLVFLLGAALLAIGIIGRQTSHGRLGAEPTR